MLPKDAWPPLRPGITRTGNGAIVTGDDLPVTFLVNVLHALGVYDERGRWMLPGRQRITIEQLDD